jgi:flagellar hook-associated protein 2
MAYASVSGLVSGLDTATIINQLMQVEANPQTLLKSRVSSEEKTVSALQALNSKLAALAARAEGLADPATWSPLTASSSSEHVAVTAGPMATQGSFSFTVVETARAHQLSFSQTAAAGTRVTAADSTVVRLDRLDGTTVDIETGDGSLDGLVRGIDNAGAGIRATKVRLDDGTYRLRVESTTTGTAQDFTLRNLDGTELLGGATVTTGRDAAISIGPDTVHSASNTFSGVLTGIDLTIAAATPANTAVEVTVARDAEAVTETVKALVDAANAALADIDELTGFDAATNKAGLLTGDATLRALRNELLSTITSAVDGASLAGVGIELDRSGRITFDEEKFSTAYAANPEAVTAKFADRMSWNGSGQVTMVGAGWRTAPGDHTVDSAAGTIDGQPATMSGTVMTGAQGTAAEGMVVSITGTASGTLTYLPGLAGRLAAVAQRASDSHVGTVTAAVKGRTSSVGDMEDAIAGWDVRLELRRQTLTRQFSAMEVMLGQLQNQSSWLAGQIGSLPKISSS